MAIITIEEAQARLSDLIHNLGPGDEVVITENNQPVAKLVSQGAMPHQRPAPGLCKGMITIVADDDEHLKDFAEYMP
jgi:prevent-host-death family protein